MTREEYKQSGLLKSPPTRLLTSKEANELLAKWHYLGPVKGILFAIGHDEGCCVFTNCRSRILEKKLGGNRVVIELGRMVGAPNHKWAMSSLMSASCKEAKRRGYELIITYADSYVGHDGMVYLAAGWEFDGQTHSGHGIFYIDGKRISPRYMYDLHGTQTRSVIQGIYGERFRWEDDPPKKRFIKRL